MISWRSAWFPIFGCSRTTPASVFDVRPCDLDVVGAIGDSLTTADNADSTSWLNMRQYPGLSWSMGGDPDRVTMPNILNGTSGVENVATKVSKQRDI